ncbi:adenylate/guanylate cyclase domain-containing protein [Enterovirga aerilata]|uniref:Adenylate/guanylate cyclase domain-containing protein n=1 Tax=Enterovirga aerilata TaxID=2730920 RepID=A0A849IKJ4_9HYPH|nr:adenylate/guanylate cyclase domain-containing protein [Enterovirga sp. DB1703]NNM74463.1 adenylate/guanylate cyclase domain-containing protein [Enterovirga sp. DB1703]
MSHAGPGPGLEAALPAIRDWIILEGLEGTSLAALLEGFARRVVAAGLHLSRAYLASPAVHPEIRAVNLTWRPATGVIREGVGHERFPNAFDTSPIAFMLANNIVRHRWRLDSAAGRQGYALLDELHAEGDVDYAAHIVKFGGSATTAMQGVALTVSTDRAEGFAREELAFLNALVPPLALAVYRVALFDMMTAILDAYIGHNAGRRILGGEIRRGHGHRLPAAILIADLRGFTAASEGGGEELIARLGEHLGAVAEPIEAAGGEVLKFLGDGLLAGFPIDGELGPGAACAAAISAAIEAISRNDGVNARHAAGPALPLDIALHLGEVFYGNVGGGGRLDFTVIGPAVNEASRIEALCGILDRSLLMSADFARSCGRPTVSLGHHRLRGVSEPREIFALAG